MIRAGQLRTLVTIETTSGLNSAGAPSGSVAIVKVYAKVEPLTGRELIAGKTLQSPVNIRLRTRYVAGIKAGMKAKFEGRVLNIDAVVDVDNRHAELEMLCVEVQ